MECAGCNHPMQCRVPLLLGPPCPPIPALPASLHSHWLLLQAHRGMFKNGVWREGTGKYIIYQPLPFLPFLYEHSE